MDLMVGTEMETSSRNKKAMAQKMGVRIANMVGLRERMGPLYSGEFIGTECHCLNLGRRAS